MLERVRDPSLSLSLSLSSWKRPFEHTFSPRSPVGVFERTLPQTSSGNTGGVSVVVICDGTQWLLSESSYNHIHMSGAVVSIVEVFCRVGDCKYTSREMNKQDPREVGIEGITYWLCTLEKKIVNVAGFCESYRSYLDDKELGEHRRKIHQEKRKVNFKLQGKVVEE